MEKLIEKERNKQDRKWGEQNHPPEWWLIILMEEVGELSKAVLEEGDIELELVQVAAVAKAMWESGKRNGWL